MEDEESLWYDQRKRLSPGCSVHARYVVTKKECTLHGGKLCSCTPAVMSLPPTRCSPEQIPTVLLPLSRTPRYAMLCYVLPCLLCLLCFTQFCCHVPIMAHHYSRCKAHRDDREEVARLCHSSDYIPAPESHRSHSNSYQLNSQCPSRQRSCPCLPSPQV